MIACLIAAAGVGHARRAHAETARVLVAKEQHAA